MKLRNRLPFAALLLVTLLLSTIVAVQWTANQSISDLLQLLVNPHLVAAAIFFVIAQTAADGFASHTALMSTSKRPIPVKPVVAIIWLANTMGITLPGPAKTPVRAVMQKRLLDITYRDSLLGIVIETLSAYFILIPATVVTSWVWLQGDVRLMWRPPQWVWLILLVFLVLVLVVVVARIVRQMRTSRELPNAEQPDRVSIFYSLNWFSVLHTFTLTVLIYAFGILRLAMVVGAFGINLPICILSAIFLLSRLSGSLSMLPMGLGVRDASLAGLLLLVGAPLETALAVTALERLLLTIPYVVAGPLAAHYLRRYSGEVKTEQLASRSSNLPEN